MSMLEEFKEQTQGPERKTEPRVLSRLRDIQELISILLFEGDPAEASKEALLVTLAGTAARLETVQDDVRELLQYKVDYYKALLPRMEALDEGTNGGAAESVRATLKELGADVE